MREKTGESLSALLDTQADDLDLQRVLNALDGDAEVSRQWRRYNVISAAMRNELGHFAQVDLSARQELLEAPDTVERLARLEGLLGRESWFLKQGLRPIIIDAGQARSRLG